MLRPEFVPLVPFACLGASMTLEVTVSEDAESKVVSPWSSVTSTPSNRFPSNSSSKSAESAVVECVR